MGKVTTTHKMTTLSRPIRLSPPNPEATTTSDDDDETGYEYVLEKITGTNKFNLKKIIKKVKDGISIASKMISILNGDEFNEEDSDLEVT